MLRKPYRDYPYEPGYFVTQRKSFDPVEMACSIERFDRRSRLNKRVIWCVVAIIVVLSLAAHALP